MEAMHGGGYDRGRLGVWMAVTPVPDVESMCCLLVPAPALVSEQAVEADNTQE